jgi:hypothetical protein
MAYARVYVMFGRFFARKDSARRSPPGWRPHYGQLDFDEPIVTLVSPLMLSITYFNAVPQLPSSPQVSCAF